MFWVNFILAAVAGIVGFFLIPDFKVEGSRKFDYLGTATFMAGTCFLVYGLNDAVNLGWSHPAIIVSLILGVLFLVAFPVVESKLDEPVVPLSIMRNPHVLVPLTTFAFVGGGW